MQREIRFRPLSGPVMAVATWLVVVLTLVGIGLGESWEAAIRSVPIGAVVALIGFAAFWRPRMVVTERGVDVVNPFRRVEIEWGEISRVDTKFALTLFVGDQKFRVWAAPAPGVIRSALLFKGDFDKLEVDGVPRPADAAGTASGDGAQIVRSMMARMLEHGWQFRDGQAERVPAAQRGDLPADAEARGAQTADADAAARGAQAADADADADASERSLASGLRVRWNVTTIVLLAASLVLALVFG